MPKLSDISIGTRTIVFSAILSLNLLLLGLFALHCMSGLNDAATTFRDQTLESTAALDRLTSLLQDFRLEEGQQLDAPTADDAKASGHRLIELAVEVEQARQREQRLLRPGAAARFRRFDTLWSAYKADHDGLVNLQQNGDADAVAAFFWGHMRAGYSDMRAVLDAETADNRAVADQVARQAHDSYRSARFWTLLALAAGLVFGGLLSAIMIRTVGRPLEAMAETMRRLAGREVSVEIGGIGRRDEIGTMAAAVAVFRDGLLREEALSAARTADQEEKAVHAGRLQALIGAFETSIGGQIGSLSGSSDAMIATAKRMSTTAHRTNLQAEAVAAAAGEATASVQSVAAAADELASSIDELGRQVARSARISTDGAAQARRGDEIIRNLVGSAERIEFVVGLISKITGQINLLALNATIEAARAGEAGRGFAVVASEVKNLASQTAEAAAEIGKRIGEVGAASDEACAAIGSIVAIMQDVSATTTSIAAAVEQQGAATAEIARTIQQTAASTGEITRNIADVSHAANDAGVAAKDVLGAADAVCGRAGAITGEVRTFLAGVQAA